MVQTEILGAYSKPFEAVFLESERENMTVEELIRLTVKKQIEQFRDTKRLEWETARSILENRQSKKEAEWVAANSEYGVIPVSEQIQKSLPNSEIEVDRAIWAFQQKEYLIFADGKQLQKLEEQVEVHQQSKIIFLKLMPLIIGG